MYIFVCICVYVCASVRAWMGWWLCGMLWVHVWLWVWVKVWYLCVFVLCVSVCVCGGCLCACLEILVCVCVEGDAYVYFCWTEMRCTDVFVYIWDRNISHPDVCGKYLSESYTLHLSWSCSVACHVSMRFFFLQNLDLSRIQSFMSWDAVPLHARVSQRKRLIQSDSGVFVIHLELFCHYFKTSMCVFIFINHRVVSDSLKHISSED